ncbi:kinase-like protein [Phanerochaete sordida]|uniref:Kinase-like protein n=1 Tax=Phanerochaete sordida TaxID=48140 RepID=A0A9P3G078_9APHY|nr:kinase-like protein [Phanerochaete sordida]
MKPRILRPLEGNIHRNHNVEDFVRHVWRGEVDAHRLSPDVQLSLPKPLRRLLGCYDERILRRTKLESPTEGELDEAQDAWREATSSAYTLDMQTQDWKEVRCIRRTRWHRAKAFVHIIKSDEPSSDECVQRPVASGSNSSRKDGPTEAELQTLEYILPLMSSNARDYTSGIVIRDHEATFWYVDRMGIVQSQAFNIFLEPYHLWTAGLAIAKAAVTPMGICPLITFTSPEEVDFRKARLDAEGVLDPEGVELDAITLRCAGDEEVPLTTTTVVGRGTAVFSALATGKTKQLFGSEPLAVKVSWPPVRHHAEDQIIRAVRRTLKKHKPQYLPSVPELKCSLDLSMEDCGLPRAAFGLPLPSEERIFRLQVMEEYLPITTVGDVEEFKIVFLDVIQAHHWVYEIANILQMDINLENIMIAERDGEIHGVLGDWDLAGAPIPRNQPRSDRKRFGSRPFMSADFYASWWTGEHFYRHDLESFYYALAAFCAGFEPEHHVLRLPDDWLLEAQSGRADRKRTMGEYHDALFQFAAPGFRELADTWLAALNDLFRKTINVTYAQLNSIHAIHLKALKDNNLELAAESQDLLWKYMDDRECDVTYRRFLQCLGLDDASCRCAH